MEDIRHVLFPTDFSPHSEKALSHLADLLHREEMELHILNGTRRGQADEAHPDFLEQIASVQEQLGNLRGDDAPDLKIHARQIGGIAPAPVAADYAQDKHIDLIVLASKGSRGIKNLLMGSVARELHNLATCHVLCVRGSKHAAYSRLLVPVDFSRQSQRSLEIASELARRNHAALHIMHVIEDQISSTLVVTGRKALLDLVPGLEKEAEERLRDMARGAGCAKASIHIRSGRVCHEIRGVVKKQGIDLIVMAGDRESDHQLGSNTQMVLHYIDTTVLVLRRL